MQILKKLYLTRKEVSKLLNVSVTALQNWYRYPEMCTPGFPRATRLSKRVYRYETKDVYDFMEKTGRNKRFERMAKDVVSEIPQAMTVVENEVPRGTFVEQSPETPTVSMTSENKWMKNEEPKPQLFETKSFVAADTATNPPTIVDVVEKIPLPPIEEKIPTRLPSITAKDIFGVSTDKPKISKAAQDLLDVLLDKGE